MGAFSAQELLLFDLAFAFGFLCSSSRELCGSLIAIKAIAYPFTPPHGQVLVLNGLLHLLLVRQPWLRPVERNAQVSSCVWMQRAPESYVCSSLRRTRLVSLLRRV